MFHWCQTRTPWNNRVKNTDKRPEGTTCITWEDAETVTQDQISRRILASQYAVQHEVDSRERISLHFKSS